MQWATFDISLPEDSPGHFFEIESRIIQFSAVLNIFRQSSYHSAFCLAVVFSIISAITSFFTSVNAWAARFSLLYLTSAFGIVLDPCFLPLLPLLIRYQPQHAPLRIWVETVKVWHVRFKSIAEQVITIYKIGLIICLHGSSNHPDTCMLPQFLVDLANDFASKHHSYCFYTSILVTILAFGFAFRTSLLVFFFTYSALFEQMMMGMISISRFFMVDNGG